MIVIPMAGLSSRFAIAGYTLPKYMLPLEGQTLFHHSLLGFKEYFCSEKFLFIARNIHNTKDFVEAEIQKLGIRKYEIVLLAEETKGQAETVYKGLVATNVPLKIPMTIFNIDTFRKDFKFPSNLDQYHGYLEVFEGSGANWSYIKLDQNDSSLVSETAEKVQLSNLCCTGLYHFRASQDFIEAFEYSRKNGILVNNELYVAPLYNRLISLGKRITFNRIEREQVVFCGIPEEYAELLQRSQGLF